jgi:hypothetical protein
MTSLFNMFGSKKETLNKPILGNKNYGERLVLSYLYDEEKKGYVLNWALSGDNNNSDENTLDITNLKIIQAEPNISHLSETLREEKTTPDATPPTPPDAITPERDSIYDGSETRPSVERVIHVGGKGQKKSRTTRRKSRKSGGKRRSRRAKRAIMVRHK